MSSGDPNDGPGAGRRVCLLTGAGGRLGNTFCQRHADTYDILAVCRHRAPAVPSQYERFVDPLDPDAEVPENAHAVYTVYADLTDPREVERVVDIALARFGGVDLLVNNAAHLGRYRTTMVDGTDALDDLQRQLTTNVLAPHRLSIRVAQKLWKHRAADNRRRNRSIVNVSSISAVEVYPFSGQAGYAASKAALNALTGHMAAEFERFGVRVNGLMPGSFPHQVPTERVADAIAALDRGTRNGQMVPVVADRTPEPDSGGRPHGVGTDPGEPGH